MRGVPASEDAMKPHRGTKPLVRIALRVALLGAMAQFLSALQLGETKEALGKS